MGKGDGKGRGRGGDGEEGAIICCGGFAFLLFIILLPMSFSGCEYYEVCLKKRRSTSVTSLEKTYGPGNHFLGPDNFFLPFPGSAQNFMLDDLHIWSLSSKDEDGNVVDAGVALNIDVSFQYQLIQEKLIELYNDVGEAYDSPIRNYAIEALKTNATLFSADQYLKERRFVESKLRATVENAISRGHARMIGFQLRAVDFPNSGLDSFVQSKLRAAIQQEKNEEEEFHQRAVLIRSQTQTEQEVLENRASEVRKTATAESNLIAAQAQNVATKTVELARNQGLNGLYANLNLTTSAQKASLDYLLTLANSEDKHLFINFNEANTFSA